MSASGPRPGHGSWRSAVSMFTIIPASGQEPITPERAARITLWLPGVGCLLAVPAAGLYLAVGAGGGSASRTLLGATLAIATLAALTGGLHLDGLADTADGLGSRRPRQEALELMRRPDVGPMGVAALVLTVLVQVTALGAISPRWLGASALAAAVVTSRIAVVMATGLPAARRDGFGALIAGTTTSKARLTALALVLAVTGAAGAAAGGALLAARGLAAVIAGLGAAWWLRRLACRKLGGMTCDVFGALIEICTATVLLVAAVLHWR